MLRDADLKLLGEGREKRSSWTRLASRETAQFSQQGSLFKLRSHFWASLVNVIQRVERVVSFHYGSPSLVVFELVSFMPK